jgi:hypothetical protein
MIRDRLQLQPFNNPEVFMSSSIERMVDRQVLLWRLRQTLGSSTSSGPLPPVKAATPAGPGASEPAPSSGVRHRIPAASSEHGPLKRALIR